MRKNMNSYLSYINIFSLHPEGIDFFGPVPSILTFTSGQSTGGIQCSNVTILDNSVVEDERSFRIILKNDTTNSRVLINTSASSLDFIIAVDINDSKIDAGKTTHTRYPMVPT